MHMVRLLVYHCVLFKIEIAPIQHIQLNSCCDLLQIPAANVLGDVNKGVYVMMSGLDYERLVLSGMCAFVGAHAVHLSAQVKWASYGGRDIMKYCPSFSGGPVGLMDACLDITVPYASQRKQFGRPIGEFQVLCLYWHCLRFKCISFFDHYLDNGVFVLQLIQGKLADMYAAREAARSFMMHAAHNADIGR